MLIPARYVNAPQGNLLKWRGAGVVLLSWPHIRRAVVCFLCLLAGCSWTPVTQDAAPSSRNEVIYVIAGGWHTELSLPVPVISGPLAALKPAFPRARYLVFGWGARDYYMARDPGFGELLRATLPGPAVMLVIPLEIPPERFFGAANVFAVRVSQDGVERLSQFLWDHLGRGSEGNPAPLGTGPYPQSVFYASTGTYSLANTCNTWTAEALQVAGLPVSAVGVAFADQVLDQLRPFTSENPQCRSPCRRE